MVNAKSCQVMKKSEETHRSARQPAGFRKTGKIFGLLGMVQASHPVSDQDNGGKDERAGARAPRFSLGHLLQQNDQDREWYLPQIRQEDPQPRGLKMAEHTEPAAAQVAGIIDMAIYNSVPVVAYERPALSAA